MTDSIPAQMLDRFANFGELLRYLRRRAGLTQTELSIAVGYSDAQISRLEQNLRLPNIPNIAARFLPALGLKHGPAARERLLQLAVEAQRQKADAEAATEVPLAAMTPSIAVLPFLNLSGDPGNEYFCDGLAEELLSALAKIKPLFVVARASAFSFKGKDLDARDIGRRLNVDTILEGSVKKAGDQLRVSVGNPLRPERYSTNCARARRQSMCPPTISHWCVLVSDGWTKRLNGLIKLTKSDPAG